MRFLYILFACLIVLISPAIGQTAPEAQASEPAAASALELTTGENTRSISVFVADPVIRDGALVLQPASSPTLVRIGDNFATAVSLVETDASHDLLILSQDRTVVAIVRGSSAGSRRQIRFSAPVSGVVQLPGGQARADAMQAGAIARHESLGDGSL